MSASSAAQLFDMARNTDAIGSLFTLMAYTDGNRKGYGTFFTYPSSKSPPRKSVIIIQVANPGRIVVSWSDVCTAFRQQYE